MAQARLFAPTGYIEFNDEGYPVGLFARLLLLAMGQPPPARPPIPRGAAYTYAGFNQISAIYTGDSNYVYQVSNLLQYDDSTVGDFSIVTSNPNITLPSGELGLVYLTLNSTQYSGNISLSCQITGGPCESQLPADLLDTCDSGAYRHDAVPRYMCRSTPPMRRQPASRAMERSIPGAADGGRQAVARRWLVCCCSGFRARRRGARALFKALLLVIALGGIAAGLSACGGTGLSPTQPTSPGQPTKAPAEPTPWVVTATNGNTTHNVATQIVVQ